MKPSLSCCGVSCCGGSRFLDEGKLDARVPQNDIAPIYDKLAGVYDIRTGQSCSLGSTK